MFATSCSRRVGARLSLAVGVAALAVGGLGGIGEDIAAATTVPVPTVAFGTVVSVNGSPTGCGTAGASGTFTLMTRAGTRTVAVTPTTVFVAPPLASASFANVCAGRLAGAVGTVSGTTLDAHLVGVTLTLPAAAVGMVASVNGSPTGCGTAGSPGTFTLTTRTGVQNVAVTGATRFLVAGVPTPTFADVCVNSLVAAVGTGTTTLNATRAVVFSRAPSPALPAVAFGTVVSVNGSPTGCGTAGASGTFTLMTRSGTRAVAVTPTTVFVAPPVASASFANVCAGRLAGAVGTVSGTTLDARLVGVALAPPAAAVGMVASVNGSPTGCGTAGSPGTFTLTTRTGVQNVAVAGATRFVVAGVPTPTFADVCVNSLVAAVGTGATTLNASVVVVLGRGV